MDNNTIPTFLCSGQNCNKVISKEWDEYAYSYIRLGPSAIDDHAKCEKIWFALMKTRIFCSNCCQILNQKMYKPKFIINITNKHRNTV